MLDKMLSAARFRLVRLNWKEGALLDGFPLVSWSSCKMSDKSTCWSVPFSGMTTILAKSLLCEFSGWRACVLLL